MSESVSSKGPAVSVIVLAYNQEKYIKHAIESVLLQDYKEKMEIIISDDCSTDNTRKIIRDVVSKYNGVHEITIRENLKNLGVTKHINNIVKEASGQLLVFLGGDDMLLPTYISTCVNFWVSGGCPSCIASPAILIDSLGREKGVFGGGIGNRDLGFQASVSRGECWVFSGCYAREVFDVFGGLPGDVRNEDQLLPFRSVLLNGIGVIDYPTRFYRRHGKNFTLSVKMARVSSFAEWSSLYDESLRNRINNYIAWKKDVKTAESWLGKEKAAWAQEVINDHMEKVTLQLELLNNPSIRSRMSLLNYILRKKVVTKVELAMLFTPYLLYMWRGRCES